MEDLTGFKIRVPPSPLWVSMFSAFGASPTSINLAETYSEVQKYVSITNHMWDGYWLIANGRSWNRIPDAMKEIIAKNIKQATM